MTVVEAGSAVSSGRSGLRTRVEQVELVVRRRAQRTLPEEAGFGADNTLRHSASEGRVNTRRRFGNSGVVPDLSLVDIFERERNQCRMHRMRSLPTGLQQSASVADRPVLPTLAAKLPITLAQVMKRSKVLNRVESCCITACFVTDVIPTVQELDLPAGPYVKLQLGATAARAWMVSVAPAQSPHVIHKREVGTPPASTTDRTLCRAAVPATLRASPDPKSLHPTPTSQRTTTECERLNF